MSELHPTELFPMLKSLIDRQLVTPRAEIAAGPDGISISFTLEAMKGDDKHTLEIAAWSKAL